MDWLLTIFALLMPLAFLLGGCPCCGTPCANCTGTTHTQVQAVISGLLGSACGSCPSIDGTYICTQNPALLCSWEGTFPVLCGFTRVAVFLTTGVEVSGFFSNAGGTLGYAWHDASAGYNSCDWSSFPINDSKNAVGGSTQCDQSAATFTITAL